jgi:hypothetical protein
MIALTNLEIGQLLPVFEVSSASAIIRFSGISKAARFLFD